MYTLLHDSKKYYSSAPGAQALGPRVQDAEVIHSFKKEIHSLWLGMSRLRTDATGLIPAPHSNTEVKMLYLKRLTYCVKSPIMCPITSRCSGSTTPKTKNVGF